jgi:hypothetical protein
MNNHEITKAILLLGACFCAFLMGRLSVYIQDHYEDKKESRKRDQDASDSESESAS